VRVVDWISNQSLSRGLRNLLNCPSRVLSKFSGVKSGPEEAFDGLLKTYVSLDESAGTIVRMLKKTPNADTRSKLIQELRNLEKKRLELLDQLDSLGKSI
jgi:hypothetical protein